MGKISAGLQGLPGGPSGKEPTCRMQEAWRRRFNSLGREYPLEDGMEPTPWITTELDITKHAARMPAGLCPPDDEPTEPVLEAQKHQTATNTTPLGFNFT